MKVTRTVRAGSAKVTVKVEGSEKQIRRFDIFGWGESLDLNDIVDFEGPESPCDDLECSNEECSEIQWQKAMGIIESRSPVVFRMLVAVAEDVRNLFEIESIDERKEKAQGYTQAYVDILMDLVAEHEMAQATHEADLAEHARFFASMGLEVQDYINLADEDEDEDSDG